MATTITGFEPPEMEQLFNRVCSQDVTEDDFSPDAEQSKPCFSQAGDLWHLGKHTVLCGDATKPESYQILLPDTKVNLVLTDPPYNVNVEETAGRIQNDNMPDAEFYQFLLSAFQQIHEVLAEDGSIYVFHSDTKGLYFRKAFDDAGFYLSGCCIWSGESPLTVHPTFCYEKGRLLNALKGGKQNKYHNSTVVNQS